MVGTNEGGGEDTGGTEEELTWEGGREGREGKHREGGQEGEEKGREISPPLSFLKDGTNVSNDHFIANLLLSEWVYQWNNSENQLKLQNVVADFLCTTEYITTSVWLVILDLVC